MDCTESSETEEDQAADGINQTEEGRPNAVREQTTGNDVPNFSA
jgi:hypothetical protein